MHRLLAALLLLSLGSSLQASPEPTLARADAAFHRGVTNKARILQARRDFAEATDAYLDLHRAGIRSPALYRKLGDAATLADRWPEAIWAYHMGLSLDPNDLAMREHLAFVRGKVIYPPANQGRIEPDRWPAWLYRPHEADFLLAGMIAYVSACVLLTIAWMRGSLRWRIAGLIALGVCASTGAALWQLEQRAARDRDAPLVVLTQHIGFHRGNGTSYPTHPVVPMLPRGMEVRRLHLRGSWLQVRLTTGEVGWVPASAALIVEP